MSELLKNQKFGVEVEFTGITRKLAANAVAEVLGHEASIPARAPYYTQTIQDSKGRTWKIMRDSSISPKKKVGNSYLDDYRVEFVTPALDYEDIELVQTIIRKFKAIGAMTNASCGIHIHVDGINHTAASIKKLVSFMVARQDLLYDALDNQERKSSWCRPISSKILEEFKKDRSLTVAKEEQIWYSTANDNYYGCIDHSHYNNTRYHGLNLHCFFSKGLIEFRLFNSTLHAGRIKAYIQFCLALSAWAIESNDRVVFRSMEGYSREQEATLMYHVLTDRLGLYGDEFKTCRYHMMQNLKGASADEIAA